MADGDKKLRRRAMAALGELLFFVASQQRNAAQARLIHPMQLGLITCQWLAKYAAPSSLLHQEGSKATRRLTCLMCEQHMGQSCCSRLLHFLDCQKGHRCCLFHSVSSTERTGGDGQARVWHVGGATINRICGMLSEQSDEITQVPEQRLCRDTVQA